jgi:hypothetical protein
VIVVRASSRALLLESDASESQHLSRGVIGVSTASTLCIVENGNCHQPRSLVVEHSTPQIRENFHIFGRCSLAIEEGTEMKSLVVNAHVNVLCHSQAFVQSNSIAGLEASSWSKHIIPTVVFQVMQPGEQSLFGKGKAWSGHHTDVA